MLMTLSTEIGLRYWIDLHGAEFGEEDNVVAIEEGVTKITTRSVMWQHFTKVKDKNCVLCKGNCSYCHRDIAKHSMLNGASAMCNKHFDTSNNNLHRVSDDNKKCVLRVNKVYNVGT